MAKSRTFFEKPGTPGEKILQDWLEEAKVSVNARTPDFPALLSLCHVKDERVLPLLSDMAKWPVREFRFNTNTEEEGVEFALKELTEFGPAANPILRALGK